MRQDYRRVVAFAGTLALLVVLICTPATAQNRIIKGKVINEKGDPIEGATVAIQGTDVKRDYTVKTNKKGEYFYMGIPFGVYRVIVRAPGYQPDFAENIRPNINQDSEIPFTLKPGSDHKLAFELSKAEMEQIKQQQEKAGQQKQGVSEANALLKAGATLAEQGKHAEALVEFKKALDKAPDEPVILAHIASALANTNQLNEALATYQKAIALKPDDAALYTNMGVLLGKMGKPEDAKEAFKKAASINPAAAAQNFYNLGATLVNSGRAADAAEAFRQAIQADPNFAEAYYQLGICLSGNPTTIPEALKALLKYTEIGRNAEQIEVAKQLIAALQPQAKKP